jgi:hypothetical protein
MHYYREVRLTTHSVGAKGKTQAAPPTTPARVTCSAYGDRLGIARPAAGRRGRGTVETGALWRVGGWSRNRMCQYSFTSFRLLNCSWTTRVVAGSDAKR